MEIRDLMSREGGIVLEEEDGGAFVLDRMGRRAMRLGAESPSVVEVDAFFANAGAVEHRPLQHLVIHITDESLDDTEACEAAGRLAAAASQIGMSELRIHLRSSDRDWSRLLAWIDALRRTRLSNAQRGMVTIDCPFGPLEEEWMEALFRLGVHCRYVSGWWPDCPTRAHARITEKGLETLARFGFYVPVVWYVHAGNLDGMKESLQRSVVRNYNAGFSLPLISSSPFYEFGDSQPALPSADDYATLLGDAYLTYPHYDLAFSPIRELAEAAMNGGWDTRASVPARCQVLIQLGKSAAVFHHIPALARPWLRLDEIVCLNQELLNESLLDFRRREFSLAGHHDCGACKWRYVCGGMDAPSISTEESDGRREQYFDANCYHRIVFLEMFIRLRLSHANLG